MKKLNQEYIQILRSDDLASANFWRLEKRIKADRRSPGVICEVSRRSMLTILVQLLGQQVITQADLVDFGPELRAQVDDLSNLYN
ncbi:multidrug transporter [Limosilactobacillus antri]|nr:multidrug transporter [Limosilactobacillus antri]